MALQLLWPESDRSGPLVYVEENSPHRLWMYRGRKPQWPHSILVLDDGTVLKRPTPTVGGPDTDDTSGTLLLGGRDYRFDGSEPVYVALLAAGYEFREV